MKPIPNEAEVEGIFNPTTGKIEYKKVNPEEKERKAAWVPRHISPAHAEQWWVLKARENPLYFIWYLTELQPARHHEIWMKQMWRSPEDLERFGPCPPRLNIVAPRESAKTIILTYTLAWFMASNPLETFGIIAVSSTIARDRLSMLRQLFTENERFKNVFPHIEVDKKRPDTQDEFTIWSTRGPTGRRLDYKTWRSWMSRSGSQLNKNPSIFAAGNGGKGVIGRRISGKLLLDDMVDETFLSPEAQNKMMRYINQTLEPCMTESGVIWNIGTRWMLDDIYEQLSKNEQWLSIMIPAILYDNEGNAMSYWPQFWPLSRLEQKRLTMNDDILFRIMYLCDPSAVSASLFRRENLHKGLPDALPDFAQVFITGDFSASLQTQADWTVLFVVGIDHAQNVYILEGMRFREEAPDAVDHMINLADWAQALYGRLDGLLIESVAFSIIFEQLLRRLRPDLRGIPVTPKGDKGYRAKPVGYWSLKGKLLINQEMHFIQQLRTEWLNFPKVKHDDTLDAISLLFQYLTFGAISAQLMRIKSNNPVERLEELRAGKSIHIRRKKQQDDQRRLRRW